MRRAVFLYNPQSGGQRARRLVDVESAASIFLSAGIEAQLIATRGPRTAGVQAHEAIEAGYDAVIACGGDGTVHDVLQGIAGYADRAVLGVIPLGTANALANDLNLPRKPSLAAKMLLRAKPTRIALGKIESTAKDETTTSFFTVTAGIGVDAELLYKLALGFKQRWGVSSYYMEALRQWATTKFARFEIEFPDSSEGSRRKEIVTQLLAVRITDFGGLLRQLAPEASLVRPEFQLVIIKTASRFRYLQFLLRRLIGSRTQVPGIELAHTNEVLCRAIDDSQMLEHHRSLKIYSEADGEPLGGLPVKISIVPDALSLLIPENARCLTQ